MGLDWSVGEYERTATQLEAAAAAVLDTAAVAPGQRLLDVACGTGNAAVRAGAGGARVTAVDRAGRLLEVGRRRALSQDISAGWVTADALELPFAPETFRVVVSVFGVIFADPAEIAAAELLRVVDPGGRIVVAAWTPSGPIYQVSEMVRHAIMAIAGDQADHSLQTPWSWGVPERLERLFGSALMALRSEEVIFSAATPEAWASDQFRYHPAWSAARDVLEPGGLWEDIRGRAIDALEEANEDTNTFRVRGEYLIATVRPRPQG